MIYISQIRNNRPTAEGNSYPYNIPSIAKLDELSLRNPVTFIIGENGSGKSTLVESIAVKIVPASCKICKLAERFGLATVIGKFSSVFTE